uniref:toll-like receptor 2 n=1 Tax=Jaculus jaculus TaxID=51337 RepID=UPI001E1B5A5E|nr:toll-like receptor 2 [Jaculus jaculus]
MLRALQTLWALGAMMGLSSEGLPHQPSLSCDTAGVCDGRSRSFRSVPSGLTAATVSLDLSNNSISYVGHGDLQRCVNLKVLLLTSNRIHTIADDAFAPLGNLEHLDLSDNHLSNLLSTWFRHLSSLTYLNLLGNPYGTIGEASLFSPLPNLQILRVGNSYNFTELKRGDFAGLPFLEELEIVMSNLQSYEPGSLGSLGNLRRLFLHVSQPVFFVEIFADLNSVDSLELTDTNLLNFHFSGLSVNESHPLSIRKLTFRNASISDQSFNPLLQLLSRISDLSELEFSDCRLKGYGFFKPAELGLVRHHVETLTIRKIYIQNFYLFSDLQSVYSLMEKVKRITVENSKVFLVPCSFSRHLKSLEYLDLSENLMVEEYLKYSACKDGWPSLQTLILRQNHLRSIENTAECLLTLGNLTDLDISKNSFQSMPETCQWPEKMRSLNLSGTRISRLTPCIPRTLRVLDVSSNNLNSFSLDLPWLQELYISGNKLKTLPDASSLPGLLVLKISRNSINTFSKEQLDSFQNLEILEAGGNSYICSCELLAFTQARPALAQILVDWPDSYLCDSPSHLWGQRVQDARRSASECHRAALVSGVCCALLLLALLTVGLCHHFHGLWYLRMTWAWLQAKRKPKKAPARDICYDAFVSYSEQDAYWVETLMVQQLENSEPPFRLCLHKRDFVPGKWIVDNIIDSIEKSRKTLFVLSENFVKSDWCKYELDFSHFRLFDEHNDAVILVLLEPLDGRAIPQRFCKLRKIMNTKTYLEWPQGDAPREGFWENLRTALKS